MRFFYPRALVRISALVQLSRSVEQLATVVDVVTPRSVVIERNDYNTADKVTIEIDAMNFPILPRLIRQVIVQVFAGDAGSLSGSPEDLQEDDALIRFIGYVDDPEATFEDGDGRIKWEARDYTALYLDTKRPSRDVVPSYGDRLDVALRRILDSVPGGSNIGLVLEGAQEWPQLNEAAPKALRDAAIPVKADDTAWHLIKRACDPVAMIPRMVLDKLVVGTSRGLRPPRRRPVFVYGDGITTYSEKRKLGKIREGVGLNGYDLSTRRYITAIYPPAHDASIAKKAHVKTAVKKKALPSPAIPGSDDKRFWMPYGAVANQDALDDAAERLFHERQRQEFEGSFKWSRMTAPNDESDAEADFDDESFDIDITGLANGDHIFVGIDPGHRQLLAGVQGFDARVAFLIDQGYSENVAPTLVRAFEENVDATLEVYVRKATHRYDEEGFELTVEFQNFLTLSK